MKSLAEILIAIPNVNPRHPLHSSNSLPLRNHLTLNRKITPRSGFYTWQFHCRFKRVTAQADAA